MRRTAADRRAEAARAQQLTEQQIKERFDAMMNKPEILAVFKRLTTK